MMKLLLHFVRRDLQDGWIGWLLILLLTLLSALFFRRLAERYFFAFYGSFAALYFAFSLFQGMSVWGAGGATQNSSLSHNYLQALPVKRSRIFWICILRGSINGIPLALFFFLLPFLMIQYSDWEITLHGLITPIRYFFYSCLVLLTLGSTQLYTLRLSLFNESIRRTVGKLPRFLKYLQYMIVDNLFGIVATFGAVGALPLLVGAPEWYRWLTLAILGPIFNLWQLKRSYTQWMWE